MKKISVLLILMVVFALFASPAGAMIGGEPDTEHTNVGAIMMEWPLIEDGLVGRLCSGTLIDEKVLLTAAHCFKYFDNQHHDYEKIWVTFHQDPFADDAEYLDVSDFIPHDGLNLIALDSHDIALVILEEEVEGINPVKLPTPGYMDEIIAQFDQIEFIAVGYGISVMENFFPGDFQLDAERHSGLITFDKLTLFEIMTKISQKESVLLTAGDSGGPLFYVDSGNEEVQVGLCSCKGPSCRDRGLHYRLDTASALDWIDSELANLED